jgi:ATP-binding cassette, subfamily B, bacterial
VQANVTGLAGLVVLIAGGTAIAQHAMTLGGFLAFYMAAGMLNGFVERIGNALPDLITGNESLLTLSRLRASGPAEPYAGTSRISFQGRIALSRVGFGYDGHDVMRDVSLEIEPGDNIAIVGPNGAGKTTILLLIAGFCRPRSGIVLADDVPYDQLDLPALRRDVGVVMQRPSLFAGTIAENIGYGHTGISRDDIEAASRLALAHEFIVALPHGYDTEIGEDGARLSGGEIQRLAIAHALVGRPRLLILDEPTNHIDADTVTRLMRGLVEHPGRPAIVTISHDDDVVRWANAVYRLDGGVLTPMRVGVPV